MNRGNVCQEDIAPGGYPKKQNSIQLQKAGTYIGQQQCRNMLHMDDERNKDIISYYVKPSLYFTKKING